MKICFITSTIFNVGGVQRVVSVLANELNRYCEVDILCINKEVNLNRNLYSLNEDIHVQLGLKTNKKTISDKLYSKVIKKLNEKSNIINHKISPNILKNVYYPEELQESLTNYINLNKYNYVIGVEGRYSLLLAIISDRINAKTIGWQHNSYDAYFNNINKYYWKQDKLFKEYIPKLNQCVVLTNQDKFEYKNSMGIECNTIYNPLSFQSKEKSNCLKKNILFVGRLLEQQKGLDLLIKAFKKVSIKRKDWTLTIVGEGKDKDKLVELIREENLNDVVKLKNFTTNIKSYYLESSIFVSTSRWEGFGLVITEAMECGLPVVAFENSGPKEIINKNGVNGVLVSKEDINQLSEKIIYLIDNEQIRLKMSKEAIERAKNFDIDNIVNKWRNILEENIIDSKNHLIV